MLVLFRILLTALFLGVLNRLSAVSGDGVDAGIEGAGWLALVLVTGIAAACTWAPVLGAHVAGPLTGLMTDGTVRDVRYGWMPAARWCAARGWRRLAVILCVLEGIRDPHLPAAFVIGMGQARAGSLMERLFAREVYRFSNVRNCLHAREILQVRHGEDPGGHGLAEVEIALRASHRVPRPELPPLAVPGAGPIPLPPRNPRIRLFEGATPAPVEPRSGT